MAKNLKLHVSWWPMHIDVVMLFLNVRFDFKPYMTMTSAIIKYFTLSVKSNAKVQSLKLAETEFWAEVKNWNKSMKPNLTWNKLILECFASAKCFCMFATRVIMLFQLFSFRSSFQEVTSASQVQAAAPGDPGDESMMLMLMLMLILMLMLMLMLWPTYVKHV